MYQVIVNKAKIFFKRHKFVIYNCLSLLLLIAIFAPIKIFAQEAAEEAAESTATSPDNTRSSILRALLWLIYWPFIHVMGWIGTEMMKILVWVSGFHGFTTMKVVDESWLVMRNFANLIFIVVLLFIAFGTILKIEAYSYKKLLPKMILAAILINFSKLICGVFVDAAQIVMLTFVNAFKGAAVQGMYKAFRLDDLRSLNVPKDLEDTSNTAKWSGGDYLVAVVVVAIFTTLMTAFLSMLVVTLIIRMVLIWVLTILSPFAFALSVLPITEKYAKEWWEMFGRYVSLGPILAFFIWLTLFMVVKSGDDGIAAEIPSESTSFNSTSDRAFASSYTNSQLLTVADSLESNSSQIVYADAPSTAAAAKALTPEVLANLIIALVLLAKAKSFADAGAKEAQELPGKAHKAIVGGAKKYGGLFAAGAAGGVAGAWALGKNRGKNKIGEHIENIDSLIDSKTGISILRLITGKKTEEEETERGKVISSRRAQGRAIQGKHANAGGLGALVALLRGKEYVYRSGGTSSILGVAKAASDRKRADLIAEKQKEKAAKEEQIKKDVESLEKKHGSKTKAEDEKIRNAQENISAEEKLATLLKELLELQQTGLFQENITENPDQIEDIRKALKAAGLDDKQIVDNAIIPLDFESKMQARINAAPNNIAHSKDRIDNAKAKKEKLKGEHEKEKAKIESSIGAITKELSLLKRPRRTYGGADLRFINQLVGALYKDEANLSDSELRARFSSELDNGNSTNALATMIYMSKEADPHEVLKEVNSRLKDVGSKKRYTNNAHGLQQFVKDLFQEGGSGIKELGLKNFGMDEQRVLACLEQFSNEAAKRKLFPFMGMTQTESDGQLSHRSRNAINLVQSIESKKVEFSRLFAGHDSSSWGHDDENGNYVIPASSLHSMESGYTPSFNDRVGNHPMNSSTVSALKSHPKHAAILAAAMRKRGNNLLAEYLENTVGVKGSTANQKEVDKLCTELETIDINMKRDTSRE